MSMDNPAGNEDLCELVRELLSAGAYEPWIQVLFTLALIFFLSAGLDRSSSILA